VVTFVFCCYSWEHRLFSSNYDVCSYRLSSHISNRDVSSPHTLRRFLCPPAFQTKQGHRFLVSVLALALVLGHRGLGPPGSLALILILAPVLRLGLGTPHPQSRPQLGPMLHYSSSPIPCSTTPCLPFPCSTITRPQSRPQLLGFFEPRVKSPEAVAYFFLLRVKSHESVGHP